MFLPLIMDCIVTLYRNVKMSNAPDSARQAVSLCLPCLAMFMELTVLVVLQTLASLRKKSKSVIMFAGFLKYRLSPDVYNYLARLDVEVSL